MTIRVLHIFAPNFRQRFGGPIVNWQLYFSKWCDQSVEHFVLDTEIGKVLNARQAFAFDINGPQKISSRWERWTWIFRLIHNLKKFRAEYDLIHFHILWWGGLLAANWAHRNHKPTIYESVLLGSDTPGAMLEESLGTIKYKLLRKFSSILAISQGIADDYLDHGFLPEQVHMQMNSIDTDIFKPVWDPTAKQRLKESFDLPPDKNVLLFIGSLIHRKGVDMLVEAFMDAARNDHKLFLWLVGPKDRSENGSIDDAFVSNIRKQILTADLTERVKIQGIISDRNRLAEAYQAADVFVFPSRNEGLPNVVLEAMACGLPVIVSELPGLKHVVEPGQNGIIVPIGDIDALSAEIQTVADDQALASRLGRHAPLYIESVHGFETWQNEITLHYQKLALIDSFKNLQNSEKQ